MTRPAPPSTPGNPTERTSRQTFPPDVEAIQTSSTGAMPAERQNRIAQGSASWM